MPAPRLDRAQARLDAALRDADTARAARDAAVRVEVRAGTSLREIGRRIGVTHEAVRKIAAK